MAFAPAEQPTVMALVLIDEPQGAYYGGAIAGPVMQEFLSNILPYLGVEPQYSEEDSKLEEVQKIVVPDLTGCTAQEAKKLLSDAGLTGVFSGEEGTVTQQFPPAGEIINPASKVIITLEGS